MNGLNGRACTYWRKTHGCHAATVRKQLSEVNKSGRTKTGAAATWFDDELIRKDGSFVPKDLKPVNLSHFK